MAERKIKAEGVDMLRLLGLNDANLQVVEDRFDASITVRGDAITIRGDAKEVEQLEKVFKELIYVLNKSGAITTNDVETVIDLVRVNGDPALPNNIATQIGEEDLETVVLFTRNGIIRAKSAGQKEYIRQIKKNDIVFAIGPAGTGKTYLAVAMAVAALRNREMMKIILARPAVGERPRSGQERPPLFGAFGDPGGHPGGGRSCPP